METILIVEDNRAYARTTANWLLKNGINARYVLSVDAAKVFLGSHEVDLVLSDFLLNDSNGVELLEWMKAQGYCMPFLIMTGYGDILGAVEAVKKGAADYLPKPVQTEEVLGIIRRLLDCSNRKKVVERAFLCWQESFGSETSGHCTCSGSGRQPVRIDTGGIGYGKRVCGQANTRIERTS